MICLYHRLLSGLRPTGFFGSFFMDNSTDLEMGAIDCDKVNFSYNLLQQQVCEAGF